MKRHLTFPCALLGALLIGACLVAAARNHRDQPQAYSIAQVRTGLDRQPAAWLHRSLRVRAIPVLRRCLAWETPGPICQLWGPALVGAERSSAVEPLPLAWGEAPAVFAFLRHQSVLGNLVPPPQSIRWATPGVYRIRLRAAPCFAPGLAPCYQAVIVDAGW
jgi:hypothetical protein